MVEGRGKGSRKHIREGVPGKHVREGVPRKHRVRMTGSLPRIVFLETFVVCGVLEEVYVGHGGGIRRWCWEWWWNKETVWGIVVE